MIAEYIHEALKLARYEIINDGQPYYAEIQELQGVWASGKTMEDCRSNLIDVIEGWILLAIKNDQPLPKIGGIEIRVPELLAV